jgi:ABC-type amino acid transport system permease subunit
MVITLVVRAAYLAEVIRSGMEALPRGPNGAAKPLGRLHQDTGGEACSHLQRHPGW